MIMFREFGKAAQGLWSLVIGLGITFRAFVRPQVTVHYPRATVDDANLQTFHGHVELVGKDDEPLVPRCISCGMCAMNCPSACLTVVKQKAPKPTPEEKKAMEEAEARGEKVKKPAAPKDPATFMYDFSLCSLCGTCVEICPVDSLRFSSNIYQAGFGRHDFNLDLLTRLREQGGEPRGAAVSTPISTSDPDQG
ncbi:NADH-quinone oxidoreductase subunit I [Desulfonatronum thiosulfatophilum]|uniref:NADH-quinone oxidoreductase subunit I n=1 Tax=Desulfonatronum thiosulfatophilum TaxID=617002 RepID=A0A1G6BRX2_9BACT|nr:4Fe-4S binding protein [Desulfonatronum thiosulfatophilum]SDB23326.1 NADH-quinone oxidoreductase subunit I [Desulfonatronum thiosulfatophilum]